jgi:hypothetical protein
MPTGFAHRPLVLRWPPCTKPADARYIKLAKHELDPKIILLGTVIRRDGYGHH